MSSTEIDMINVEQNFNAYLGSNYKVIFDLNREFYVFNVIFLNKKTKTFLQYTLGRTDMFNIGNISIFDDFMLNNQIQDGSSIDLDKIHDYFHNHGHPIFNLIEKSIKGNLDLDNPIPTPTTEETEAEMAALKDRGPFIITGGSVYPPAQTTTTATQERK